MLVAAREKAQQLLPRYECMRPDELRVELTVFLSTEGFVEVTETATLNSMMGDGRYFLQEWVTKSASTTRVAQEVYYGQNFFRFAGALVLAEFLDRTEAKFDARAWLHTWNAGFMSSPDHLICFPVPGSANSPG
jgi:hypothetical protein